MTQYNLDSLFAPFAAIINFLTSGIDSGLAYHDRVPEKAQIETDYGVRSKHTKLS